MKSVNYNIRSTNTEINNKNSQEPKKYDQFISFKSIKSKNMKKKLSLKNKDEFARKNSIFHYSIIKKEILNPRAKNIQMVEKSKENNIIEIKKNREIKPIQILERYARDKIKKDYISPYINRLIKPKQINYKIKKNEDKPIYYNLYRINDMMDNKKSRTKLIFIENIIYLSENEYLLKFFNRYEYRIMIRYLLGYVFIDDINSRSLDGKINQKKKVVLNDFIDYINNNYTIIEPENEINNVNNNINKKVQDISLLDNILNLSLNAEIKKNVYPFLKWPKHFLIKDMPKKMIPKSIPNYYFNGNLIYSLIKKYYFYRKFNINIDLLKEKNKISFFHKIKEEKNIVHLEKSVIFNVADNISDNSSEIKPKNTINELPNTEFKSEIKIKYFSKHDAEISPVENLIKNIDQLKEEKKIRFKENEKLNRHRKHANIRKKEVIKQPYEYYEIIKIDDFYIDKTEKSNSLNVITNEMIKLASLNLRNTKKYKTRARMHINPNLNTNENINILTTDKFIRKKKYFLTHGKRNFINNDYFNLNKTNKDFMYSTGKNIFKFKYNFLNEYKDKKFKVYKYLDKQKRISFSIFPKNNMIKFKDLSQFLSEIKNSLKEHMKEKTLLKGIITNYHKNNKERSLNINFTEDKKLNIMNIKSNCYSQRNKIRKTRNKNELINKFLTERKSIKRDNINIEDIFSHKSLKMKI